MMMRSRSAGIWLVLLTAAVVILGTALGPTGVGVDEGPSAQSHDGPEHEIELEVVAVRCPDGYENGHADDVCLAYDDQIPGPTLAFQTGDDVAVTLVNRIDETLAQLDVPAEVQDALEGTRVSLHRHGVSTPIAQDGVAAVDGTQVPDSSAPPGGSFTYRFTTPYRGTWHYHDHVMGPGGEHGQERGLFGTMIVTPSPTLDEQVVDLHVTDEGANGGLGLDATADTGSPVRLAISGLGNWWWNVRLSDPDGALLGSVDVGPGVSRALFIEAPEPGTYTWTARSQFGDRADGTITVEASPGTSSHRARADPGPQAVQGEAPPPIVTGHRVYVLSMEGNAFNGETWPDTPLLEAYASERLTFVVHVPAWAEAHTFHVHGHPWHDPDVGRQIDTKLLKPGETHVFNVTAGLAAGHTGDWLYHCHVDDHFSNGMFGILRVYPIALDVGGSLDALEVTATHEGEPVEGARWSAELDGRPIDVSVVDRGDGRYVLDPALSAGASGELVLTANKEDIGESVARLSVDGDGYELVRDVGDPGAIPASGSSPSSALPGLTEAIA